MCSPLKEVKVFNKNITALRSEDQKSPEDYIQRVRKKTRVQKTTRVRKTTRNTKNHKTIKSQGNQGIQEVRKRLPSLKNPESQESGRLA